MIDLSAKYYDGIVNWYQFNDPDSGEMIARILIRVKFRNPENHSNYMKSILKRKTPKRLFWKSTR